MEKEKKACGERMEIYSRIVGYFRPVENWNAGKKAEFEDRKEYRASYDSKKVISPIEIIAKEAAEEAVKEAAVVTA
jgi:Anaerobic ribonucleoside-triphosphate reductase